MPADPKDYNDIELETVADLRAEGHDSFEEMAGPLRRRMAAKTGQTTRLTPWFSGSPWWWQVRPQSAC